jgi:hypothetical protein
MGLGVRGRPPVKCDTTMPAAASTAPNPLSWQARTGGPWIVFLSNLHTQAYRNTATMSRDRTTPARRSDSTATHNNRLATLGVASVAEPERAIAAGDVHSHSGPALAKENANIRNIKHQRVLPCPSKCSPPE